MFLRSHALWLSVALFGCSTNVVLAVRDASESEPPSGEDAAVDASLQDAPDDAEVEDAPSDLDALPEGWECFCPARTCEPGKVGRCELDDEDGPEQNSECNWECEDV